MFSLLTGLADLIGSVWTLFNSVTNGIMGFAGFPEEQDDATTVPTWLGAVVWFIAVGGLLATTILLAIQRH